MKIVLTTLLTVCVCLMVGCGQESPKLTPKPKNPEPNPVSENQSPEDFLSLKALAEKGDAEAQVNLGMAYQYGEGPLEDAKEAVKWFRKAAEQGDAEGQINLGAMYDAGEGVPEDIKEAVKWYRKAAEQGHAYAQRNLGVSYKQGTGVPEEYVTGYAWYNISAANGEADAKENISIMAEEMTAEQIAKAEALVKEMVKKNPKLIQKKE